ncbi:MAG TPA: methyltransferase domain-containing protein, partial [Gammaproteobacteria bacterium]|nr:methyltransferase domain-containing protein [Gammaproteobacteria bacterium]
MSLSLDDALPETRAARRAFDRAVQFESACFIHDEARARLLARLDIVRLTPAVAVDLGCATGRGAAALAARYPTARVLGIDSSRGMLRTAAASAGEAVRLVAGDATA